MSPAAGRHVVRPAAGTDQVFRWAALAPALDEALAALTAEAVGRLRTVLADTVAYSCPG